MTRDELIELVARVDFEFMGRQNWNAFDKYQRFAELVEERKCEELADQIEKMPFGDTAASFATWVRSQA